MMAEKTCSNGEGIAADQQQGGSEDSKKRRFREKYTLDSDEEDVNEDKKHGVMDEDDIEGCEEDTIEDDEGTKITPFNMREELEEGHFDAQGNYVWNKDDNIRDNWMDNVDWVKVKRTEKSAKTYKLSEDDSDEDDEDDDDGGGEDGDSSDDDDLPPLVDRIASYRQMTAIMRPNETVTKTLRRLGEGCSKKGSASSRWKKQKKGSKDTAAVSDDTRSNEELLQLTGLADRLLGAGDYDVYVNTFEKMSAAINEADSRKRPATASDVLDMFSGPDGTAGSAAGGKGESSETGKKRKVEFSKETSEKPSSTAADSKIVSEDDDVVRWMYKLTKDADAMIFGPFTSLEMAEWAESKPEFKNGVFVRKSDSTSTEFYDSRRIDFESYI